MTIRILTVLAGIALLCSCKKDNEKLVSSHTYRDIVYRVDNNEPDLEVIYSKAIYEDTARGNIDQDTMVNDASFTQIPATVLVGLKARLYALSYSGGDFALQIRDNQGTLLAKSDSVIFDPANQLHPDRYYASISIIP